MKPFYLENADQLLDIAFRKARKEAAKQAKMRSAFRTRKEKEIKKIEVSANYLAKRLDSVLARVPRISEQHPFLQEIMQETFDVVRLKKSLSQLKQASKIIKQLKKDFIRKSRALKFREDLPRIKRNSQQFYGRISSVMKSLNQSIGFINQTAKKFSELPRIKFKLPTVILAGYPNTGKTTLLKKLTGAKAKIASYPFTTQKIELGYFEERFLEIQVADTPGLLDRPEEKRNPVERKAVSALRHLANCIVFVLDATETCGFALEKQLSLLQEVKKQFNVPLIIALNKTDLMTAEQEKQAREKLKKELIIKTSEKIPINELKKEIRKILKEKMLS